jgi:hypothetical protein
MSGAYRTSRFYYYRAVNNQLRTVKSGVSDCIVYTRTRQVPVIAECVQIGKWRHERKDQKLTWNPMLAIRPWGTVFPLILTVSSADATSIFTNLKTVTPAPR